MIPGDADKTRHLVPEHWGEKARSAKLREKLAVKKEKRSIGERERLTIIYLSDSLLTNRSVLGLVKLY